jgi:hypothetical protein
MIEKMVEMVQAQTYGQILFIMGFGFLIVATVVGAVFVATKNMPTR